jgi:DNA-binding NtrC family response regulator
MACHVLARRHDDAEARTGLGVDVRIDAALAYELEPGQALEQGGLNCRALADEHEAFGVLQARSEHVGVLHVVVPDRNLVTLELLEAWKRAHRVEVIVQDRNLHASRSRVRAVRSGAKPET